MERAYNTDLGGVLGYGVHEFAKAGFRDLVDMGHERSAAGDQRSSTR
jgi:hypothetical protein